MGVNGRRPRIIKTYMGYDGDIGPEEEAVLIFAHNLKEAKKLAVPVIQAFFDSDYIAVRVCRLWNRDHLFAEADQKKLAQGIPHVIDSLKCCVECECWGYPLDKNGVCEPCQD